MNKWNIPTDIENYVKERDKKCIYCGVVFDKKIKKMMATWEHIINDAKIITKENIALCCCSCNASKGAKDLQIWLYSDYCKRKNITVKNIASVARHRIKNT